MNSILESDGVIIDNIYYRVLPLPDEKEITENGPDLLHKGVAYIVNSPLTDGWLLPYHKEIEDPSEIKRVGLYLYQLKNGSYLLYPNYPRKKEEAEKYKLSNMKNIAVAMLNNEITPNRLTNISGMIGVEGERFRPPIRLEDDASNKLMKLAIREKNAPFEPFGKLLEFSESHRGRTPEGVNAKNNAKRGLNTNTAMSFSKFDLYASIWGLDYAFIIKDSDDCIYPLFPEDSDKCYIYYPRGNKFDIDPTKLIDVSDKIEEAIAETSMNNEEEE